MPFIDALLGRVTLLEWVEDRFQKLKVAESEHSDARLDAGDLYEDLRVDLSKIDFELVDFRQAKKSKRGARRGSRPWKQIVGTCGHQTAAKIDDVERCVKIPAHALVTPTAVGLAHPPTAYLYCQHAGNRGYNGLEISCRAAGIEGNSKAFWRSRKEKKAGKVYDELVREVSDVQILAGFLVWRYWHRLNALNGYPHINYIWHRNTHKSRVSDPGSRIAAKLTTRLEVELSLQPASPLGSGTVTPWQWGGAKGVPYNRRIP